VKDDSTCLCSDLVAATHGRGFFILDDIEPLREVNDELVEKDAHLFLPQTAFRVRWDTNTDTPPPPDEPASRNPPDGAVIDYFLKQAAKVQIEILDASGAVVRRYSSSDPAEPPGDEGNVPRWWIRPPQPPSGEAGLHRFVWDVHWPSPPSLEPGYPIAAIPHDTPREPRGPWAMPGSYTVRLTAGAQTQTRPLEVRMDPRIKTPQAALRQQLDLSQQLADALRQDFALIEQVRAARKQTPDDKELEALEGTAEERRPWAKQQPPSLVPWNARIASAYDLLQSADAAPTPQGVAAARQVLNETAELFARAKQVLARRR